MLGMMLRIILVFIVGVFVLVIIFLVVREWFWYLGFSGVFILVLVFGFFLFGIVCLVFFVVVGKDVFKCKVLVLGFGFCVY